jgi:hypothetical protein
MRPIAHNSQEFCLCHNNQVVEERSRFNRGGGWHETAFQKGLHQPGPSGRLDRRVGKCANANDGLECPLLSGTHGPDFTQNCLTTCHESPDLITDSQNPIRLLNVKTQAGQLTPAAGSYYVSLNQPLAGLVTAALEPDSQNSFVANRLMVVGDNKLLRVMKTPSF